MVRIIDMESILDQIKAELPSEVIIEDNGTEITFKVINEGNQAYKDLITGQTLIHSEEPKCCVHTITSDMLIQSVECFGLNNVIKGLRKMLFR